MDIHQEELSEKSLQQLKEKSLGILMHFHELCERNNLKYILNYGTLLGAIRHEGFIPWDDDLDVGMPREDYEKFKKIAATELPEHIHLQIHDTEPNYFMALPRLKIEDNNFIQLGYQHFDIIHGPWIDIFIYDYKLEDKKLEDAKQQQIKRLNDKFRKYRLFIVPGELSLRGNIVREIKKALRKLIIKLQKTKRRGFVLKYMDNNIKKTEELIYEPDNIQPTNELITHSTTLAGIGTDTLQTLPLDAFENRLLQKFEGKEFYIPKNYDKILTSYYGDYMQLPPLEERITDHYWAKTD